MKLLACIRKAKLILGRVKYNISGIVIDVFFYISVLALVKIDILKCNRNPSIPVFISLLNADIKHSFRLIYFYKFDLINLLFFRVCWE